MNANFKMRQTRIGALTAGLAALFVIAGIRLLILVLVDGPRLASLAVSEHHGELELAAIRGPISDRNGQPLALSAEARSVYARPRRLLESSTADDRRHLAAALGIRPEELARRLARKSPFVWLARHLAPERARAFDDMELDGLGTVPEYHRFYPEQGLAAAVVGQAGMDGQGLSGVELQYDSIIRGAPVELSFYRDALGHPILDSPVGLREAQPGARVELTIDSSIQGQAENYLTQEVAGSGAQRGSAVVLDPFSGEVLALANIDADAKAGSDRLHDGATQDAFEPGSTMKGILGAIALDDHVIDTQRRIYCENGEWHVTGRAIHDDSPHGWLDLGGIVEVSSNIGAAKIALSLRAQRFSAGLAAFGIGRKTGIDLPGEASGLLRPAASWRPIELADHGFGQGVAVTPIQLATAYAAIANGGVVMRPYVVKAAYAADGHEIFKHTPQVWRRAVSPETAHTMNLLLRGVVNAPDGTGRLAQVADFTVAGKTGTAQMVNPATGSYYQNRLVASFVGFVPAQDPRLVILVVLYDVPHGHFGGLFAAPVFSKIAASALQELAVTPAHVTYDTASILPFVTPGSAAGAPLPTENSGDDHTATPAGAADQMTPFTPDFHRLSLRSALALARQRKLNLTIIGAGYVTDQHPAAGRRNDGSVNLVLADDPSVTPPSPPTVTQRSRQRIAGVERSYRRGEP